VIQRMIVIRFSLNCRGYGCTLAFFTSPPAPSPFGEEEQNLSGKARKVPSPLGEGI